MLKLSEQVGVHFFRFTERIISFVQYVNMQRENYKILFILYRQVGK